METPNVFLITGTSTGFGRELVLQLNAQGHKVIATARNLEKIRDFEQLEHVSILKLDISSPHEEVERVVQEAIKTHGYVTHLINNAAYGVYGCVEEVTLDQARKQFETNYWGTIKVTDAILPHFRTRKEGEKFITTVSSLIGITTVPYISFYCASKFAIEATFEALRLETQHLGIKVLLIEPGYFRTNFLQAETNIQKPTNPIADYAPISNALGKVIQQKHGTQEGDPKVGSQRIIELMTNTGFAKEIADGSVPVRVALGSDAYQGVINKANNLIENANKWKDFSCSTDFKN
ncbi:putative short-chain oxidoreductase [Wallemia mellicola]|nr:putative short-chain oxidoreductase [Wallemia mellicola]